MKNLKNISKLRLSLHGEYAYSKVYTSRRDPGVYITFSFNFNNNKKANYKIINPFPFL